MPSSNPNDDFPVGYRVSMGYILGLRKEPFKQVGTTRPSPLRNVINDPGAMIEWAASDGRKGKISGQGKAFLNRPQQLNAKNLAKLPSKKQELKVPSHVPVEKPSKASSAKKSEDGIGMMGLFDAEPDAPGEKKKKEKEKAADKNDAEGWTKEQDEELMRRKTEGETWADIVTAMNKDKAELAKRFGQIKPKDWRPNQQPGKNKKGGKQDKNANAKKGGDEGNKENGNPNSAADSGNNAATIYGATDNAGANNNTNNTAWMPTVYDTGNTAIADWTTPGGSGGGGDSQEKDTSDKDKSRDKSHKKEKKSHKSSSKRHKHKSTHSDSGSGTDDDTTTLVSEFQELHADEEFSVHELVALAKLLKEDRKMLWVRVASRFRDKTGRIVNPDVLEEKLAGKPSKKEKREKKIRVKDV